MKFILTILLTLTGTLTVMAQQITVKGKVVDADGNALPYVMIYIDDKQVSATSNQDGIYSLNVPSEKSKLTIRYLGYEPFSTTVGKQRTINVTLHELSKELSEIVVVGYATARRRDLTGSVSSVSGSQIEDMPVVSVAQALQGRMPGVVITQSEGSLDADIKFRIRGGGSITQDNSPLFIVDGFPVDDINDIAPSEISSIDVLKDASSTAIYGARGANGVVIVTTKSGVAGKPKISYNTYYGVSKTTKYLDVLSPYEYALWQYEVNPGSNYTSYFGDIRDIDIYKTFAGSNWQKEILGNTGTHYYNNITISGGTKDIKYNAYVTRDDINDIMMGSELHRTNVGLKVNIALKKWLKLDANFRHSNRVILGAGTSSNSRLGQILQFRPFETLVTISEEDADQGDENSVMFINPVLQTQSDYRRTATKNYNYNAGLTANITKRLTYRLEGGVQYNDNETRRFYGINTSNAYNYGRQPLASIQRNDKELYRMSNVLTYTMKPRKKHHLTVMLGEELTYSKSKKVLSSAKYFPRYIDKTSALAMMNLGIADPTVTDEPAPDKISSFFGRINYDFDRKYLLSVTMRADGSSKFKAGNRWGYFPSAGFAWRMSKEKFMKSTRNWLDDLKLRVSYGQSGNNRILSDAWQKTYSVMTGLLYMNEDGTPTSYFDPSTILENPDLKWETTITRTFGIDFSMFKSRFSGSVELYYNTTKDLLIQAKIPPQLGYTSQWQNIGRTSNKGIEITLNGRIIQKRDFTLRAQFNIGFNRNKVVDLGNSDSFLSSSTTASGGPSGDFIIKKGGKVGLMYGYVTDGMYSFDDFDYDASTKTYTLKPGVPDNSAVTGAKYFGPGALKFVNQNPEDGDMIDAENDMVVIGDANPLHTGGFTLNATFKGFDAAVAFNWSYGNDIYNLNKLLYTNYRSGSSFKNILGMMTSDNRFMNVSPSGEIVKDPEQLKEMNRNATYWSAAMTRAPLHSWAIEDGSFLRLNNVTIGYSFPKKILSKLRMQKLRLYFTAQNLWTWTNYSGYDPEVDAVHSTPLTPGVDYNAYPRSRSFHFGANITF